MSEEKKVYLVNPGLTLESFRARPCCAYESFESDYVKPSPQDVADLIALAGWSQVDVAKITGVSFVVNKGSATVRRWKDSKNEDQKRQISYSAWRLLLIRAGVIS